MSPEGWVLIIGAIGAAAVGIIQALKNKALINTLQANHEDNKAEIANLKKRMY